MATRKCSVLYLFVFVAIVSLAPLRTSAQGNPTTTVVTSPTATITVGDTVTFTATVSAVSGTPTGLVTFLDGTTPLGSATLSLAGGNSEATFSTSLLHASTSPHSITATYQGDGAHTGSTSSAISLMVNTRTSTTGVVLNPTT